MAGKGLLGRLWEAIRPYNIRTESSPKATRTAFEEITADLRKSKRKT